MLSKAARAAVKRAIDLLYDKAKARLLGRKFMPKRIIFSATPRHTLPELYGAAAREELAKPDEGIADALARIAAGYLDAARARAHATVASAVERFLIDADARGVETDARTVLGGQLAELWRKAKDDVKKVVETEATTARNMGTIEGVSRVSASLGDEEPTVYFVVVRDASLCRECKRLHLLEDEVTPRCWKLSEVSRAYHKKGDDRPSVSGEHPSCRCGMVYLAIGYGFDGGMVAFVSPGHDELKRQRS